MSEPMKPEKEYDYYYVVYFVSCPEHGPMRGASIIPHSKTVHGFNIVDGINHIQNLVGHTPLIQSWQKTTKKRYEQFIEFLQGNAPPGDSPASRFTLLQGGKFDGDAPAV